jgi:hypothetical protein
MKEAVMFKNYYEVAIGLSHIYSIGGHKKIEK